MTLAYAVQKMIQLVQKDDPTISVTQKVIHLNQTEHVNLAEHGFDVMVSMYSFNSTSGKFIPWDIPSDIGSFRMITAGKGKTGEPQARAIPTRECKHSFGSLLNDSKWVKSKGANYPKCFDLN